MGEVNVVEKMKETNAVIGGEGNGGIILPELHYGRDALVGIALFLSHLATSNKGMNSLRAQYPNYVISKNKIQLEEGMVISDIIQKIKEKIQTISTKYHRRLKNRHRSDWCISEVPILSLSSEFIRKALPNRLPMLLHKKCKKTLWQS